MHVIRKRYLTSKVMFEKNIFYLQIENKELRDLLEISKSSVKTTSQSLAAEEGEESPLPGSTE